MNNNFFGKSIFIVPSTTMMLSTVLLNRYEITGQLYTDTCEAPPMDDYIDPYCAFDLSTKCLVDFETIAIELGMPIKPGEDLENSEFWKAMTGLLLKKD